MTRLGIALSVVIGALVVSVASLRAQGGAARRIVFEHDGVGVTGYALYVTPDKGAVVRVDLGLVPAAKDGSRSVPLPVLVPGSYRLAISAYNGQGESAQVPVSNDRVVVDAPKTQPKAASVAAPTAPPAIAPAATAPAPTAAAPTAEEPKPAPEKKGSKGVFGRVWGVVVGQD